MGVSDLIRVFPQITSKDVKIKIKEALHRSATIDADQIEIETIENKVILRGTVRSHAEKADAENAAWSLPGITKVENKTGN